MGASRKKIAGAGFEPVHLAWWMLFGRHIAVVAVGEENGFFALHGNFKQAGEGNDAFAGSVANARGRCSQE